LVTKFQASKLLHDYGLLWIENAPYFYINSNEFIKKIVDKYLIIDQTILKEKNCTIQLHQHKTNMSKEMPTHLLI
jgi:hypothetical protein